MKKSLSFLTIIILLVSFQSFATIQINDVLNYNGNSYPLNEYFLEKYFQKHPDKKPETEIESSNLWRGYVAEFEIEDGKLFLTDLKIKIFDDSTEEKFDTKYKSVYKEFESSGKPFFVKWVNSIILIPIGEPIEYNEESGLIFLSYNLIEFKNGIITFEEKLSPQKYRSIVGEKYYGFLKKEELYVLKKELKK